MEPGKVCQFSTATNGHIITNTVTVANVQVDYSMRTALTVAALKGHVEVVQMLLQSGKVHVDRQDLRVSMLFINHLPILFMYIMLYILYIYIVAVSNKYFNNSSNIIMSISLIHILIISVHVWGYSCCYLFLFYSSVCIKYIGTMYGVYVSNQCILL